MTDPEKKTHKNSERLVKCPVDDCDAEVLGRGIHLHVRRSEGTGHGPQGDVPDHITFDDLETTGKREVEMEYPEERNVEAVARLCPFCWQSFSGGNGVMIHLGQVGGRKNHPEEAAEHHEPEDFPPVELDKNENVIGVVLEDESHSGEHPLQGTLTAKAVYRYIAMLLAEGKFEEVNEARQHLLPLVNDRNDS